MHEPHVQEGRRTHGEQIVDRDLRLNAPWYHAPHLQKRHETRADGCLETEGDDVEPDEADGDMGPPSCLLYTSDAADE